MEHSFLIGATFRPSVGNPFHSVAAELQLFARDNMNSEDAIVDFMFESRVNVAVKIAGNTDLDLLEQYFYRALEGCIPPNIGPWPKPLTSTEEAHDRLVRLANTKLKSAPDFLPRKGSGWSESNSRLWKASRAIFWARLMQVEIINASGKLRKDVVAATALEAGFDNDPGGKAWAFNYLRYYWEFGPKLGAATRGRFRDLWTEFWDALASQYTNVPIGSQNAPYQAACEK